MGKNKETAPILIVIPARAGSKRLPAKNKLQMLGKPLFVWSVEAALKTKLNSQILVSTDDEDIISICENDYKNEIIVRKRPQNISLDNTPSALVIIDAIQFYQKLDHKPDTVILLQPTSPLRTASDVEKAHSLYKENHRKYTTVTVCLVKHPTSWIGEIGEDCIYEAPIVKSKKQENTACEYILNGAVYVFDVKKFTESQEILTDRVLASVMPRDRSVDIDDKLDFLIAERLLEARAKW